MGRLLRTAFFVHAAVAATGCCVLSRPYGPRESDVTVAVEPVLASRARVDRDGFADEASCRQACGTLTGEVRRCRFTSRLVETPGSPSLVVCYRFPEDGSPELVDKKVPISEEQRRSLDLGPRDTLRQGCPSYCNPKPGGSLACKLEPGRPRTATYEPVVVCHMFDPGGCGPVTYGN